MPTVYNIHTYTRINKSINSLYRVKVCVVVPPGLDDTVVPGRRGHHGSRSRQNQIP